MIFDSLGLGELGVVVTLIVVLVKPKELGKILREFGKLKRKVLQIQTDVKSQLESITVAEEAKDKLESLRHDKAGMRKWAKEQVAAMPATERAEASRILAASVAGWSAYARASVVSCFAGTLGEVDTDPLLRRILEDGKTLLMPYVDAPGPGQTLGMAVVKDPEGDLSEGAFGILEPNAGARAMPAPEPDLVLVPGACFDLRGGRLGKGMGFYDRYLAGRPVLKAGLCFDVQITQKNLALDPHDQLMDAVVSERRLLVFSAPRPDAGAALP